MIKHMVKVYIFIKMVVYDGEWKNDMQHGYSTEVWPEINLVLLDIILKNKNMLKEKYNFVMVLHMKVLQSIMKLKAMVFINGLLENNMKDNGKTIK